MGDGQDGKSSPSQPQHFHQQMPYHHSKQTRLRCLFSHFSSHPFEAENSAYPSSTDEISVFFFFLIIFPLAGMFVSSHHKTSPTPHYLGLELIASITTTSLYQYYYYYYFRSLAYFLKFLLAASPASQSHRCFRDSLSRKMDWIWGFPTPMESAIGRQLSPLSFLSTTFFLRE